MINDCDSQQNNVVAGVVGKLQNHHRKQLALCDRLEAIADSLPDRINKQECLHLSWLMCSTVCVAHHFEEREVFPLLLGEDSRSSELSQCIERLTYEHWEDESSAEDISIALRQMVAQPGTVNIGKIAYMLRGFFEGLRRHVAFETEHLLPMLRASGPIN